MRFYISANMHLFRPFFHRSVIFLLCFFVGIIVCYSPLSRNGECRQTRKPMVIMYAPRLLRPNSDFVMTFVSFHTTKKTNIIAKLVKKSQIDGERDKVIATNYANLTGETTQLIPLKMGAISRNVSYYVNVTTKMPDEQFVRQFNLTVAPRRLMILIQLDKPMYKPEEIIRYRVLVLNEALMMMDTNEHVDVRIQDPETNLIYEQLRAKPSLNEYKGLFEGNCTIGFDPVIGTYGITVTVGDITEYKNFTVSHYVLPRFSVTMDTPNFYCPADARLEAFVKVRDSTGKPVDSTLSVEITGPNIPSKHLEPTVTNGNAHVQVALASLITMSGLVCPKTSSQFFINITATAVEKVSGKNNTFTTAVPYFCAPFRIQLTKSSKFFYPGLPFKVTYKIVSHDGQPYTFDPAFNEKVKLFYSLQHDRQRTRKEPPTNRTDLLDLKQHGTVTIYPKISTGIVLVQVGVGNVSSELQINGWTVSGSDSYLQLIASVDGPFEEDATFRCTVNCTKDCSNVTYTIVRPDGYNTFANVHIENKLGEIEFDLTADMAPHSKLFVYYVTNVNEVVSATLDIQIARKRTPIHIGVKPEVKGRRHVMPGREERAQIHISARQKALIGFLAIDKSLLLLAQGNDITNKEMDGKFLNMFSELTQSVQPGEDEHVNKEANLIQYEFRFCMGGSINNPTNLVPPEPMDQLENGLAKIVDRKDFRDSFLFKTAFTDENGELSITEKVPDSITTWAITAFAIFELSGLAITEQPAELEVFQEIYAHIDTPANIIRREEVTLPLYVYNHHSQKQVIKLQIMIKFSGTHKPLTDDTFTKEINANNAISHSVTLKPLSVGNIVVRIRVFSGRTGTLVDSLTKEISVIAEGVKKSANSDTFPIAVGSSGRFTREIPVNISAISQNVVADSERISLLVHGDMWSSVMSQLMRESKSRDFQGLIRLPQGCGEQNMAIFMPNVFLAIYLRRLGDKVFTDDRQKVLTHNMRVGYDRQFLYRLPDGSFSTWGKRYQPGSTWLTAYVLRGFHTASEFIKVDFEKLEKSFRFLENQMDPDTGEFVERGFIIDKNYQGHSGEGVALTAFVLLAFRDRLHAEEIIEKASGFLERSLAQILDDPFTLAITTYALVESGKHQVALQAMNQLNAMATKGNGVKFWKDQSDLPGVTAKSVETTAYALLAILKLGYIDGQSDLIVNWLLSQRNDYGGFVSTQDTVVALEALGTLAHDATKRQSLVMEALNGNTSLKKFNINKPMKREMIRLPRDCNKVIITAKGEGAALCQLHYVYHEKVDPPKIVPASSARSMESFEITHQLTTDDDNPNLKTLQICPRYKGQVRSGMVVLEVTALTGFVFDRENLPRDANGDITVEKIDEMNETTVLYVYVKELNNTDSCLDFGMAKKFSAKDVAERHIKIYRYYETGVSKTVAYGLL